MRTAPERIDRDRRVHPITGSADPHRGSVRRTARRYLHLATEDLAIPPAVVLAVFALPAMIVLVSVLSGLLSEDLYKALIVEDGPFETLQLVAFLVGMVLSIRIATHHRRVGQRALAACFLVAAVGLFLVAGEEISWGQRFFGWETPEAIAEINRQGETTIHNVHGIELAIRGLFLAVGVAGTIAPLVLYRRRWLERYRTTIFSLVPHPVFIPAFAGAALWRAYRLLFEAPAGYEFAVSEFSEVIELVFAVTIALFLYLQVRRRLHRPDTDGIEPDARGRSPRRQPAGG